MKCVCGNTTEFYGESLITHTVELNEDDSDAGVDYILEKVCEQEQEDTADIEWKIKCTDCNAEQKD